MFTTVIENGFYTFIFLYISIYGVNIYMFSCEDKYKMLTTLITSFENDKKLLTLSMAALHSVCISLYPFCSSSHAHVVLNS